jgi:ferredoxin-NADP reductase
VQVLTTPSTASSVLAVATTVHLAFASLRNHRRAIPGAFSPLAIVSLALAVSPWLLPSPIGLAAGFALQLAWFGACELMAGPPPALAHAAAPRAAAAPLLAAPPRPAAPAPPPASPFVQAPVLAAIDETADIKTFRLARPAGFEFEAGQFLTVMIRADGKDYARCYSISSAPDVRGYLEISVKRQGVVSNALHATARPGALLSIRSPKGKFKYPGGDDRPIVLIAGGVGITPLMSMLRHAIRTEPARPVTLVYSAATEQDFAFRDELASIAKRHPRVRVILAVSRQAAPPKYAWPRRIDAELLGKIPDLAHSIAMICGPAPLIDGMKALLAGLGVPPAQIRSEVFQAAIAASLEPSPARAVPAPPPRGGLDMLCARSARRVPIAAGRTLLEAAEDGGIEIPSLCRAGVCGTCRTRVTAGDVDCASLALDEGDRAQGFVLACVATARSSCTVDA